MMKCYGQVVVIGLPQRLEHRFGLAPRIDEDESHLRLLDLLIDLGDRMHAGMPGPRHPALADQHIHHRRRTGIAEDDPNLMISLDRGEGTMRSMVRGACALGPLHRFAVPLPRWGRIGSQPRRDHLRIIDRRRQRHTAQVRRKLL